MKVSEIKHPANAGLRKGCYAKRSPSGMDADGDEAQAARSSEADGIFRAYAVQMLRCAGEGRSHELGKQTAQYAAAQGHTDAGQQPVPAEAGRLNAPEVVQVAKC